MPLSTICLHHCGMVGGVIIPSKALRHNLPILSLFPRRKIGYTQQFCLGTKPQSVRLSSFANQSIAYAMTLWEQLATLSAPFHSQAATCLSVHLVDLVSISTLTSNLHYTGMENKVGLRTRHSVAS